MAIELFSRVRNTTPDEIVGERRASFRVEIPTDAQVQRTDGRIEAWQIINLSTTGLLCSGGTATRGEYLRLAISIPGHGLQIVAGEVVDVRTGPAGEALAAIHLSEAPTLYRRCVELAIVHHFDELHDVWPDAA